MILRKNNTTRKIENYKHMQPWLYVQSIQYHSNQAKRKALDQIVRFLTRMVMKYISWKVTNQKCVKKIDNKSNVRTKVIRQYTTLSSIKPKDKT